jgi:sugar lactone lactonase YvrE
MTDGDFVSGLYRVDPDRHVHTVAEGVGISNGLGWSADVTRMYYIDTPTLRVDMFDYDAGTAVDRRPLVDVPLGSGYPDGMTVDSEDHLWVAFWDGWCVRRYDPDGDLVRTVELPVARPTSCAFGGARLDELYVTTASRDLSEADRAAQAHAGAVLVVDAGVTGRPSTPYGG